MTKVFLGLVTAAGFTLAVHAPAHALTTWNFSGSGGVLGSTQTFTATDAVTVLTAAAFSFADGSALPLHQSAEGLGIVGGCTNDISACGSIEFLRLEFPTTAWIPVGITLERLADNGNNAGDPWNVFADNDGNLFDGATFLTAGDSTGAVNRQLSVLFGGSTPFKFLYIMPAQGAPGSDFRVSQVVGELPVTDVPEPRTLAFAIGAVMLGIAVRRRSA